MADDEQFSLCWNNFNSNLSAGFHESLCRGDLVDVTLAAEGQFVKAHRLVLSVCSPYFRKMFTQMPANQHAFVFLKDVSHTALKDLIQFMYCGEVNVKQEALPAFISTAEALQIKGLTDSDPPPSQTPPEPSTPTPQLPQQIQTSPRVRQRPSAATRPYKIETVDDGGDDSGKQTTQIVIQTTATAAPQATMTAQAQTAQPTHLQTQQQQQHIQSQLTSVSMPTATTATVVTHKRPAQRTSLSSVPHVKRTKSTIDPLEGADATTTTQQISVQTAVVTESKAQVQQQQQQQQSEPEYIDLPIELPTKSEPDYADETGEVDQAEGDTAYVEDESYGDMRYDESYFTENEDAAPTAPTNVSVSNTPTGTTSSGNNAVGATTSKAIVKQQTTSFSDTSYVDTGDQTNNDAQDYRELLKKPEAYSLPFPIGVWLENPTLYFMLNQKQGYNLIFHGYMYKKEASFRSTVNWICSNGNGKRASDNKCTARCITKMEGSLKLGKNPHNHPPKFTQNSLPANLLKAEGLLPIRF
ncbi:modifier of mdg4-like isoform X14 [Glossina fuscipes]|uniref:Modifier of mdg4-like isoform X14 n=1 Tax=Glossina fuscipes TaxID=7396 RepID=A0A8U0WK61_9MUSC|nr:modifier of mdg4-like isoform X14 [Glossina fuscipes]XP_037885515.1 modifier of mdg4-like isoform X14 [Glossina fuscipes]